MRLAAHDIACCNWYVRIFPDDSHGFVAKDLSVELLEICESTHQTFLREKGLRWWGLRVVGIANMPVVEVTSNAPDDSVSGPQRIIVALGFRGQIAEIMNLHHLRWLSPPDWLN